MNRTHTFFCLLVLSNSNVLSAQLISPQEQGLIELKSSEATELTVGEEVSLQPDRDLLIIVPKDALLNDKTKEQVNTLLDSCLNCQDVPVVGGDAPPTTKPKTTTDIITFCKRNPGKHGCPKNDDKKMDLSPPSDH